MGANRLHGYETVAERMTRFYNDFPQGAVRTVSWEAVTLAEQSYVVVSAVAYRTPDDPHPGTGTAWEPVPGRTAFVRFSEVMNAETSAWGRALASLGFFGHSIATQDEISPKPPTTSSNELSAAGQQFVADVTKKKVAGEKIKLALGAMGVAVGNKRLKTIVASLSDEQIQTLRGHLNG